MEVSDEILEVQKSVDEIQRQIGNTFNKISTRDGSANHKVQMLLNLLKELDNRATTLHGHADSIIKIANEISSNNKNVLTAQQTKIDELNQNINTFKDQYDKLQQLFNSNVRQKVSIIKEFSDLNQKYIEFTDQEGSYEKKQKVKILSNTDVEFSQQTYNNIVINHKHYKSLINDLDKQISAVSSTLASYSSVCPKVKVQYTDSIQRTSKLSDCKQLLEKIVKLDKEKAELIKKQNEILRQINSKENEINQSKEYEYSVIQQHENSLICEAQSSPFCFRSMNRKKLLKEQIEITELELDQTKHLLAEVSEDCDKQLGYETSLGDKLLSYEEGIKQIDDENESLSSLNMSMTSEINNNSQIELQQEHESENLFESLRELRARLREEQKLYYEVHDDSNKHVIKDINDIAKESIEVLAEKEAAIRKKTAIKFAIKKEKSDIENLKAAIIRATEHIEKLNGEQYKLEKDATIVHSIKNDCKSLSGIQSGNVKRVAQLSKTTRTIKEASIIKLAKTVSDLEKEFSNKSERVSELSHRVSLKSTIAESGNRLSESLTGTAREIEAKKAHNRLKDRMQTVEKVSSALTKAYGVIRSQMKKPSIAKDSLIDYDKQLDKLIDKTDDLITWVQVFGKDSCFHIE